VRPFPPRRRARHLSVVVVLALALLAVAPSPASAAVVAGATITTTANPTQLAIGETTQYTLTVVLPAGTTYHDATVINTVSLGMTAVGGSTLNCVSAGQSCLNDLPGRASGYALAASGQKIGWYLGTVEASAAARVITIVFGVHLDDVARNVIAGNPTNASFVAWNTAEGSRPANAAASFVNTGPTSSLLVRVKEPLLGITTAVSDPTPEPGTIFGYTTTVSNANATYTSSAFAVTVTTAVPSGVIVEAGSISGNGVLSGGLITWTLPAPIVKNASVVLTWSARLAATTTLVPGPLVATARIVHYESLSSGGRNYPAAPVTAAATVSPDLPALTVVKTPGGSSVATTGTPFGWTVTVTNTGRGQATALRVDDVLPANWSFDSGSSSAAGPVISANATTHRQSLSWTGLGVLEPGQSLTLTYTATPGPEAVVDPGAGLSIPHENVAKASALDRTGASASAVGDFSATATSSAQLASADLAIGYTLLALPIAGTASPEAWSLEVTNLGPDPAAGPFVVTESPDVVTGVTITSASGDGWSCGTPDSVTGAYSCIRADANETLAAGASFPDILVVAAIDSGLAEGTELHSEAAVSSPTWDANLVNNVAFADATAITRADIEADVQVVGVLAAGEPAVWTVDVRNDGPSISTSPTVVVLTVPEGIGTVVADGTGWTCTGASTITCRSADDLGITSAPRITITGELPSSFTGQLTMTVQASGATADPTPSNNTDTVTTTVRSATTLVLDKRLDSASLVPGALADYVFTIENTGFADATGVYLTDELPSGLEFEAISGGAPGQWSCSETVADPSTFRCGLSEALAPGAASRQTLTVTVRVPSSLVGDVVNTATLNAANAPSAVDSDDTQLVGEIDLGITKSHGSGPVYAGTTIEYTVTVHNYGPSDAASGLIVADTVPVGFTPIDAGGAGWDCGAASGQVLTCVSTVVLSAGSSSVIVVRAAVPAAAGGASYSSGALVSAPANDPAPDPHENFATDTVEVLALANVTVLRSIVGLTLTAGDSVDYTIIVSNSGPSTAEALNVTGLLPAGFTVTGYTGPGWDCSLLTLVCSRASLGVGTSTIVVTVTLSSDIPDGTVAENTAVLSWTDSRADRNVDVATVDVTVQAIADLELTKTSANPAPSAGEVVTFELVLENPGLSDAAGPVFITDTLPVGLRFVSAGVGWDCTPGSGALTDVQPVVCTMTDGGGLVAGGTAVTLVMDVAIDPALDAGTVTNTATSSSVTVDSGTDDNSATLALQVAVEADLDFHLLEPGPLQIGGVNAVTVIVGNAGPSVGRAVAVAVTLPAGLRFASASSDAGVWTCTATADPDTGATALVCDLSGTLDAQSDSVALVLNLAADARAYPTVLLSLGVTGGIDDPDLGNNSAVLALAVDPLVALSLGKSHEGVPVLGGNLDYLLTVSNAGPTEDPGGFTVVDTLPDGLDYRSYTGDGVTCVDSSPTGTGTVTCTFDGPLAVGQNTSVVITVTVLVTAPTVLVNTAVAASLYEQLSTESLVASDSSTILSVLPLTGAAYGLILLLAALLVLILGLGLRLRRQRPVRSP